MFCKNCGNQLDVDSRFCTKCGNKVENDLNAKFCVHCGSKLDDDSVFCMKCGGRIKDEAKTSYEEKTVQEPAVSQSIEQAWQESLEIPE